MLTSNIITCYICNPIDWHTFILGSSLSDDSNYDAACHSGKGATRWDPPLLYDLNVDPGERHSLSATSEIYK